MNHLQLLLYAGRVIFILLLTHRRTVFKVVRPASRLVASASGYLVVMRVSGTLRELTFLERVMITVTLGVVGEGMHRRVVSLVEHLQLVVVEGAALHGISRSELNHFVVVLAEASLILFAKPSIVKGGSLG